MINVDALAQEIRRVDGRHDLGAGQLAEALMPFLSALEPQQEEAVADGSDQAAIEIADAVIAWMVKYDLLDADLEYRDDDIIEVLDDLVPTPVQKEEAENPYRDELYKLAAELGEPDDPFASWEALAALKSTPVQESQTVSEGEAPLLMRVIAVAEGLVGYADLSLPDAQVAWIKWRDVKAQALKQSTAALASHVR